MYSIIGSWWCVLTYTPVRFQNAIYGLLKPAGGVMQIIIKTYNVNWASVHSSHTALDTPTPVPKDSYSTLACWSSKAYIFICVCVHLLPMILNVTFSRQGRCFTRSSSIHISRTFRLLCTTWQKPKLRSCCCCACIPGCRSLIWKKNVDSQFYLQGNWWKAYMKIENAGLLFSNQNFLQYYCKFYPLWSNQLVVDRYLQGVDYYSLSPSSHLGLCQNCHFQTKLKSISQQHSSISN